MVSAMQEKTSNYVKGTKLGDVLMRESDKKVTKK